MAKMGAGKHVAPGSGWSVCACCYGSAVLHSGSLKAEGDSHTGGMLTPCFPSKSEFSRVNGQRVGNTCHIVNYDIEHLPRVERATVTSWRMQICPGQHLGSH